MPDVRLATSADLPAVGETLAAAFVGDPIWEWMVPPSPTWKRRASAFYGAEARLRHGHGDGAAGEVWVDDQVRGAALWASPGAWRTTLRQTLAITVPSVRFIRGRIVRGLRVLSAVEGEHPADPPHWYLAYLGTDPEHQGHGIGSALIEAVTSRCDEQGLGAYLESSKESNVAFYARHGFEVRRRFELPGGPPMWLMWREPKG